MTAPTTHTRRQRRQQTISTQPTAITVDNDDTTSSSTPQSQTSSRRAPKQQHITTTQPTAMNDPSPGSQTPPPVSTAVTTSKKKKSTSDSSMDVNDESDDDSNTVLYSADPTSATAKYPRTGKRGAPQVFARKLYEILENEPPDAIGWTSSGASFIIKDMDTFVTDVLMKYFRHQKYSSFQRQLNLYGFRKISKGGDAGAYAHESFVKGKPELLYHVRRMPQASANMSHGSSSYRPAASKSRAKRGTGASYTSISSRLADCFDNKKGNKKQQPTPARRSRRQPKRKEESDYEEDDDYIDEDEYASDEELYLPAGNTRKSHPTTDRARRTKVARAACTITATEASVAMTTPLQDDDDIDEAPEVTVTAQVIEPVVAEQLESLSSRSSPSLDAEYDMESLPFESELLTAQSLGWDVTITSQPTNMFFDTFANDGSGELLPCIDDELSEDVTQFLTEKVDGLNLMQNEEWVHSSEEFQEVASILSLPPTPFKFMGQHNTSNASPFAPLVHHYPSPSSVGFMHHSTPASVLSFDFPPPSSKMIEGRGVMMDNITSSFDHPITSQPPCFTDSL